MNANEFLARFVSADDDHLIVKRRFGRRFAIGAVAAGALTGGAAFGVRRARRPAAPKVPSSAPKEPSSAPNAAPRPMLSVVQRQSSPPPGPPRPSGGSRGGRPIAHQRPKSYFSRRSGSYFRKTDGMGGDGAVNANEFLAGFVSSDMTGTVDKKLLSGSRRRMARRRARGFENARAAAQFYDAHIAGKKR